jgi:hypothetical protein
MLANGRHNGRRPAPLLTPFDAWAMRRKLVDLPVADGELQGLSSHIQQFLDFLGGQAGEARALAFQAYIHGLPGPDQRLIFDADPRADRPPAGAGKGPLPARSPSLADLVDPPDGYFLWKNRLVRSHLNIISSEVKVGKTRIFMDLTRRLWFGLPFPDEQEPALPERTITLWVCGDRHHQELKKMAGEYGVPDEAVRFCARPETPRTYSLDDEDTMRLMAHYADIERPGLIFIDTVWRATHKQMKIEEDVNALFDPILDIAEKTGCTVFCASHLSKDGDTLGRRPEGAVRSIMKLYYPDPDGQKYRRRLTTRGNFEEPPDFGLTLHTDHIDFDHDPPKEPEPEREFGRPPSRLIEACQFIAEKLRAGEQQSTDVMDEWEDRGGSKRTLDRARDKMVKKGEMEVVQKPGASSLWKAIAPTAPADNQEEFIRLLTT